MSSDQKQAIEALFRQEGSLILATLIRVAGNFELAEDARSEAFAAALKQWPEEGIPPNPRAWLIMTGRYKVLDALRKTYRQDAALPILVSQLEVVDDPFDIDTQAIEDDQLRLIFICCHPSLPEEARIALTLREVCGLTTEEIARAFLSSAPTIAQRIVRAKAKIRDDKIPYEIPSGEDLPERLGSVLKVAYLVFNEGYYASSGYSLTRPQLTAEAIRLMRLIAGLMPETEVLGLLALMLFQESRHAARTTPAGEVILMPDQDRSLWNRALIDEALGLVRGIIDRPDVGMFTLQAATVSVHSEAKTAEETDWGRVVFYYDRLLDLLPSPVVELNRAVAVAMHDGPSVGLALVDNLIERGELVNYGLAHSIRGELLGRLGRSDEARTAYQRALELAVQDPERRFLQRKLDELSDQAE